MNLTRLTTTSYLALGVATLWVYPSTMIPRAFKAHHDETMSHISEHTNSGAALTDMPIPLSSINEKLFPIGYVFTLLCLAVWRAAVYGGTPFWGPVSMILVVSASISFYITTIVFLVWCHQFMKQHEQIERTYCEESANSTEKFIDYWEQKDNELLLFLILCLFLHTSPVLATYYLASFIEWQLFLLFGVLVCGFTFHIWGTQFFLHLYNNHIRQDHTFADAEQPVPEESESEETELNPDTLSPLPTLKEAGFELMGEKGRGGMATVYLALQTKLERQVAIKVMSTQLSASVDFKNRFMREARILAELSHPNITTIYDVGEAQEGFYLAMEYAADGDLKARMKDGLEIPERLGVIRDVSLALHFAHEHRYIHRDIKPENILFSKNRTLLTDFGIAKSLDSIALQLTQTGISIGTPAYMAPEQFDGRELDHRTDLYSLGVLLFEILSGTRPFRANSTANYMYKHLSESVPSLPASTAKYQHLVDRLMMKDPADRPPDALWVTEQLEVFLSND